MTSPTAMPVLETARLRVRPFVIEDLEEIHRIQNEAWREDEPLADRERWLRYNIAAYESLAAMTQPPYGDRAVVVRETGALVGTVGLVPAMGPFGVLPSFGGDHGAMHSRPEVGLYWAIDPARQGLGFATEAARAVVEFCFSALNLERVVATTEYENAASIAVMRKLGMSIERNPKTEPPWFQVVGMLRNPALNRPPPELRTERLLLRAFQASDAAEVWDYQREPEQYRYIELVPPAAPEECEGFVRRSMQADARERASWAIVLDGRVVGDIEAQSDSRRHAAEIGYSVAQAVKGRGIATEAARAVIAWLFDECDIDRVHATADARNTASRRVLEKCGMRLEGIRRLGRVKGDERPDETLYAVLREDWERARE